MSIDHLMECDTETRSPVDLKKHGVYNYMANSETKMLLMSWRINHGPWQRWRYGQPCPPDVREHFENGRRIRAHNSTFERLLFQIVMTKLGWPSPPTEAFSCTAAAAAAMALPRSLDDLGEALDLKQKKDKRGKALIQKFSKPRRPRKDEDPDGLYWNEPEDFPEEFDEFADYCEFDIMTEAEADERMVPLSDFEQRVYTMYERINDRGVRIDLQTAHSALRLAEKAKKQLDREMREVTGGYVGAVSQPGKLVEWVSNQGVVMNSAQKAEIESLLEMDDLPAHVRRAIEIRQEGAKSSVSKLQAMIDRASADGRVRGTGIYHAASTGRRQSVGVNLSNLPRPRKVYEDAHLDTQQLFKAFRSEDPDYLRALYGPELGRPLHLISDAIRGFIWSAPGHDIIQADYSGIEGAVIAWSSDEQWKIAEMFAIIADPSRADLYRQTAADIMGTTTEVITKKHWLRQALGKTSELSMGFQGGVSAFHNMALNYGIKLDELYAPVWGVSSEERREKAIRRYGAALKRGKEKTDLLSREAWIACELIKVGWRQKNAMIAKGWSLREDAVREAIRNPGTVTSTLKFKYVVKMGYLWAMLPSGRALAYASPKLRDQVWAKIKLDDGSWSDAEVMDRAEAEKLALQGLVDIQGNTSPAITTLGVGKNGKMRREHLYGGLIAENDTQAIARDILVNGEMKAEAAGYQVINDIYDEILAEVPQGFGSVSEFEKLICELPDWADGLPLTAGGFRAKRYKKE